MNQERISGFKIVPALRFLLTGSIHLACLETLVTPFLSCDYLSPAGRTLHCQLVKK